MKKAIAVLVATVALLITGPIAAQAQPPAPFSATITLTGFGGGTQEQNGNVFVIRDLQVTGDAAGDLVGSDVHNYNATFNGSTGVGNVHGTQTVQATSPCVGMFSGNFRGKSIVGDFPDQDSGSFSLLGSGGCDGYHIIGKYTEPQDGVFVLTGFILTP